MDRRENGVEQGSQECNTLRAPIQIWQKSQNGLRLFIDLTLTFCKKFHLQTDHIDVFLSDSLCTGHRAYLSPTDQVTGFVRVATADWR
jgi:hypothetical protein